MFLAYDFTNCDELGVTIAGVPFGHLLFELALSFRGWRWPMVALSERFEALVLGVQEALWQLGGVVEVLRSDNRSAATHELPSGGRALTWRYRGLLEHYGMKSTRIFPAQGARKRGGRAGPPAHQVDPGPDVGATRPPRICEEFRV